MWAQCDIDGNQYQLAWHAVKHADGCITVKGQQHMKKTTKGWQLCIQWKDGTTSWERLADLKEYNPVEAPK
jgi:hypothetical protein